MKNKLIPFLLFIAMATIGFGQNTLAGKLTVQQTIQLTGDITPTAISANQNDYTPTGLATASVVYLSSDSARNITGLTTGADGRQLQLYYSGAGGLTLVNESSSSTAANRFSIGADYTIPAGGSVLLNYDSTASRWKIAGSAATIDNLALNNSRIFEIKHWWNALYAGRAGLWVMGDSVGAMKPSPQYFKLYREYGFGGYLGHNYSLTAPEQYTGGAAQYSSPVVANDPAFVIWPTGQYYTVPSGGTLTRLNIGILEPNGWTASKLKVIYNAEAGAGVFKVQVRKPGVDWYDAPGASSVNATVGTGNKVLSISLGSSDVWDYRIVGVSGGTTKICESGLVNTTGVCIVEIWRGSLPLDGMMNNWASANAAVVFADAELAPNLITQEVKDYWTNTTPLNNFETLLTNAGVSTSTDVCYIGSSPDDTTDAQLRAQNAITLERARYYGRCYWNGYTLAETYAKMQQAFNSTPGDIHLNNAAQNFLSNMWAKDIKLFGSAWSTEKPLYADTVRVNRTLSVHNKNVFTALEQAIGAAKASRGEVNFTGVSNAYLTGSAPSIGTSDFTWCGWVYIPRLGEGGSTSSTNYGMFGFSSSIAGTATSFSFAADYDPTADEFRLTLSNSTGLRRKRCSAFLATYGGAFHLVTVRRSAGLVLLNIGREWYGGNTGFDNGVYSESTLGTTTPPAWTDTITSTYMLLGRTQQNGIFRASEVAVWTRALTDAEVFAYADSGIPPATPNALYFLNESRGLSSYDASGNGLTLTHNLANMWLNQAPSITSVSVTTANGVSGSVANPTTTPAITFTLAAITPTTVAATDTTDASSSTVGAMKTAGGLAVAKKAYIGGGILNVTAANGTNTKMGLTQQGGSWDWQMDGGGNDLSLYVGGTNKILNIFNTGGIWAVTPMATSRPFMGGSTGAALNWATATYNDSFATGTQTKFMAYQFVAPTVTATSAVTWSDAYTFFISGDPTAGSNATFTRKWTLGLGGGLQIGGDLSVNGTGKTVTVKSGTNALAGTVTLTAGAGTISSTAIDANTVIVLTLKTVGGTVGGQPYVDTITAGTGCTVTGGGGSNTSTYNWVALKVN